MNKEPVFWILGGDLFLRKHRKQSFYDPFHAKFYLAKIRSYFECSVVGVVSYIWLFPKMKQHKYLIWI